MEFYKPELMRGIVDVQRELAQLEEIRRSALRPFDAAAMAGLASVREACAADVAGVGLRAAEVASGLELNGMSKIAADLAESQRSGIAGLGAAVSSVPLSVLDAGATAAALKPYGQWKASLMRWAEPPLSQVVSAQLPSLARLVSDAVRPQLASASFMADLDAVRAAAWPPVELSMFELPGIDLPPWSPYVPEDVPEAEPAPAPQQEEEAEAFGNSTAAPADLLRRIEALERELAHQRRPFVVRLGEKVVAGLLVRVIWEQTPVSDYTAVVIDKLEVVIDGVTYILPYIP